MGKLSNILAAGSGGNINDLWNSTAAEPVPVRCGYRRSSDGEFRPVIL